MSGKPSPCRLSDLVTDPAVHGDLLALGAALVHVLDHEDRSVRRKLSTGQLARMAFMDRGRKDADYALRSAISRDARRYEREHATYMSTCEAPMIRREGPCGKPAGGWAPYVTDWETGEEHEVSACYRHREWQRVTVRRNRNAKPENPPTPCANTGGVLRAHFPELDWAKLYGWATYNRWVEPPEREPVRKPTLQVIVGDGEGVTGDRAMLTALPGGTWSSVGVET